MAAGYDFDNVIDRRGTRSKKWRKRESRDVIPMGVADMDFPSPPAVLKALHTRIEHGIFGYTHVTEDLTQTIQHMLETNYEWKVDADWLVWLPGLVAGLNIICRATGAPGDQVITSTPVYPPFLTAPLNMKRDLVTVPLLHEGERWTFDFDRLEQAVTPQSRLFLLCNPHNPVSRVFTQEELETLAEFCLRHDLWICADEIHCELVLDEDKAHLPLATLRPEFSERTVTLMSPSKTFNLAGIGCAFAIIPNPELREAFLQAMAGIVPDVNTLGYTACQAAYRESRSWHQSLLEYLRINRDIVQESIAETDGLSVSPIEATYLAWIDVRSLDLEHPGKFFEEAGVDLWDGADFDGPGFVRLNFGCPRSLLLEGLQRIRVAAQAHQ